MFIDIDYDKRKKGYKINLAKPNQQTIASISEAYGANYSIKLGNINEVTFNVPYFIDKLDERVKNENIELIKEKMYTKISYNNSDEWMVIDTIEDVGSGDEKYMTVTAFTNVYETSNRKINELNLEIVNPEEYYSAVLNDVAWSIGTIDPLFKDIYRSVELSNVTVLEAIITGAETFGAVLDFDTENKKINLIDMDSRAKYRGLNINYSNFLQSINRKRSVDEMTTRLYVYGSEDLSIENVNPTGMRYLEDFTYFLYPFERDANKNVIKSSHYMSDELAHAILDKNELSREYQPQIKALQKEIDEETVEYINETTLLNELRFDEMSVSGLLDIAKATGDNDLILQRQDELAEIKTKVSIKELTVDHIDAIIEDLERQISQLQSQISVTSFSKKLYDELSMYIIESEFMDDRYIDEEELYRDALKKFDESKSPSVVIEASIDNIIDSLEEDYYSDKVVLGDIARVTDKEMDVEMKSLIVELSFDLDNNTCDVTIANGDIEKDGYDRILSVLYDTQSTTTMLENNKYKWDTVTDVKTEVDLMRDSEIDATRNRIKAGFRESVTIEDRGIILSNPDFPDEIVIMQAGVIALSTDGGENWSTSITPRGVMADTIIGKLVASNNLIVTNDSGSFRIDGDGLTVDMDSIKITSGEGDTPENIVDSWNKMLITMDEFADDGKLNEYEKNQIARQWNSIAIAHSSMVDAIQNAYGPETTENPYPAEYEIYMESYERLRGYLNDEIQSDGHTILDPLHRSETTDIDSDKYNRLVSDYEVNKDRFQTVIPLEFSQTFMEQTRKEISLNYVKNGEVATKLNLSEEGVRIDGRLLEVNAETHFNDDLVMNAGLIRSADNAINIDLNKGIINLSRPLTINAVPVATEDFVEENLSDAIKNIDVEYGITSDKDTPPSPSDWNTTPPAWKDGKYIWSRTITVYKNGKTEMTKPVNITGATGSSGGIGQDGRSVKSIQEQYYLSTSPLDLEEGRWMDEPPKWEPDKYIWTRSVITYENPSGVGRTEPISVSGQQGPKGEDAPLVKLSGETQIIKQDRTGRLTPSSDFTVTGSSMNTTINSWRYSTDGGDFITSPPTGVARSGAIVTVSPTLVKFNTLTIRASDGHVSDEFTVARAVDGATGEDAYTVILTNESHTFAGNIIHAIPSSTTTDIIAYKGSVRVPVTIGSVAGMPRGMNNSISSNGTINTRVTFTVDEKLVEESGTVKMNLALGGQQITKEFSFAVAYKGERGDKGDRGVSITKVDVEYAQNTSATTAPTSGWNTTAPTWKNGQYIWSRTKTTYSSGDPTYSKPACITGQKGSVGGVGNDGKGISSIVEQYYLSDSKETRTGGNWTTTVPKWEQGKYMWTRSQINWINPTGTTYTDPVVDSAWEAMQEGTKGIGLADKTEVLSGTEVYTDRADDSAVHVEIDGNSYQSETSGSLTSNGNFSATNAFSGWNIDGTVTAKNVDGRSVAELKGNSRGIYQFPTTQRVGHYEISFRARSVGAVSSVSYGFLNNGAGAGTEQTVTSKWEQYTFRTSVEIPLGSLYHFYANSNTGEGLYITGVVVRAVGASPDNPIEIRSLNYFDVVSDVGRNYYAKNSLISSLVGNPKVNRDHHDTPNGFEIIGENNGVIESFRINNVINSNGWWTVSFWAKSNSNNSMAIDISDMPAKDFTITTDWRFYTVTSEVDKYTDTFNFVDFSKIGWAYFYIKDFKVEKGKNPTPWTPAPEDITENDNYPNIDKINLLLSQPLRSVGDVKDRLYRDSDGVWKVERNVEEHTLTGIRNLRGVMEDTSVFTMDTLPVGKEFNTFVNKMVFTHGVYRRGGYSSNDFIGITTWGGQSDDQREIFLNLPNSIATTVAKAREWFSKQDIPLKVVYSRNPTIEILDQGLQDELNNLRSFKDSNYVYTLIEPEQSKPTLHATFKGGGWYSRWKTEDELVKQQKAMEDKADSTEVDALGNKLGDYVLVEGYENEIGEIGTSLRDYKAMIEANEVDTEKAIGDVSTLITRTDALTENLGEFTRSWAFLDTKITMGNEGLLVGEYDFSDPDDPEKPILTNGILIGTDRIDFVSNKVSVAHITGQLMQIDHGIFVETLTVGEHKIETMSGGHTIWQWIE